MLISPRLHVLALVLASYRLSFAQVVPITPGPNETYTADSNCTIAWKPDMVGTWTNMTIDLMSGPNNNMSYVTNVAMSLDGTDSSLSPYVWPCPEVDPYSAIYFYQFTNGNDIMNRAWTTRFTIASPANQTVLPANSEQPSGEPIPWGIGYLKSKTTLGMSNSSVQQSSISPDDTTHPSTNTAASISGIEAVDNDNNDVNDPQQTLKLTPEAPNPTESKIRTAHGHKTTDVPDDGDDSDVEPSNDSGTETVAKTKTVNIQAERSHAAQVSALAQGYSRIGTESPSLSPDPNAPAGRGANAAAQNNANSQLGSSSDTTCRCSVANRATSSRLADPKMSTSLLLFVVSGAATILV